LFSCAEKFFLPTTTQTRCILFCRAAKNLGIYQQKQLKLTVFCSKNNSNRLKACSAVQRKNLEFVNKSNSYRLVLLRSENVEMRAKALHFVRPRSEKFWNLFGKQKKKKSFFERKTHPHARIQGEYWKALRVDLCLKRVSPGTGTKAKLVQS
jgi:hypothetical protein